jgi:hypothetical protein
MGCAQPGQTFGVKWGACISHFVAASIPVGSEAPTKNMARKRGTRIALVLTDCRRESGARTGFERDYSHLSKDKATGCAD